MVRLPTTRSEDQQSSEEDPSILPRAVILGGKRIEDNEETAIQ
jgi:hypothetical protein